METQYENLEQSPQIEESIENILQERMTTHGDFRDVAATSQMLKNVVAQSGKNYGELSFEKAEAIDNILQKISRLVNGDSNHIDSWKDICGYSTLVTKGLQHDN